MKISVIVPVYNGASTIKKCLDSIVNQTYKDIEIVVVDDGSNDGTKDIVDKYAERYPNIIVVHKKNAGLPQARKTGVETATGEYIGFVDADDYVEEDMYRMLYDACIRANADVSYSPIFWEYTDKVEVKPNISVENIFTGKEALEQIYTGIDIPSVSNKLFRIECLKKIKYPTGNFVGEDHYILTQAYEKSKKVIRIPAPLYHYVQIEESMCRGNFSEDYFLAYHNYYERKNDVVKIFPEISNCMENYIMTILLSWIVVMGKTKDYNQNMIKKIKTVVKNNIGNFLKADYVDMKYKCSAIGIMIYYKTVVWGNKLFMSLKK